MARPKNEDVNPQITIPDGTPEVTKVIIPECPFEMMHDCGMFKPERSESGGWLIKARLHKMGTGTKNTLVQWDKGCTIHAQIEVIQHMYKTGIKYDSVFNHPHFIKNIPKLILNHGFNVVNATMDIDGELVLVAWHNGAEARIVQGNVIAELVVL